MSTDEKAPAATDVKTEPKPAQPKPPSASPAAKPPTAVASPPAGAKRPEAPAAGPVRVSGKPTASPTPAPGAKPASIAPGSVAKSATPERKASVFKPRPVGTEEPKPVSGGHRTVVAPPVMPSSKPAAVPMGTPSAPSRPTTKPQARPEPKAEPGVRKVRLVLQTISPLSVMKLAFLLSFAFGIGLIVCVAALWMFLDSAHVFVTINDLITQAAGDVVQFNIADVLSFSKVMSVTVLVALADIIILTVLTTIGAMLYNVVARGVGGVHVTLTDE